MKMRTTLFCLLTVLTLMMAAPAMADSVLYDNGPQGPDSDAWTINFGFAVSDNFTLTQDSTVTGFRFYAWLLPGDILESVEVSFTSQELGGTTYFDGVLPFTQSNCSVNAYGFNVCVESASFSGPNLAAGTYWVNLQNAMVNTGDPIYWDENSGVGCTSPGCPSLASESSVGTIPSESFTILGTATSGTTPEPGTILLSLSGIAGVLGISRRRFM